MRLITAKDIAKIAKVSPSTVYRAINDQERISQQTKIRILKIANKRGYRGNDLARGLVLKKTWKIGIILQDLIGTFSASLLAGVTRTASQHNYDLLIKCSLANPAEELKNLNRFLEMRIDGLLVVPLGTPESCSWYKSLTTPFVFMDSYLPGVKTGYVVSDIKGGVKKATRYLIKKGHSDIALVTRDSQESVVQEFVAGYLAGLREGNLSLHGELIIRIPQSGVSNSLKIGEAAVDYLIRTGRKFSAMLGIDDWVIMGAMRRLRNYRSRTNTDKIDYIGFDDVPPSSYFQPAITTIRQNPEIMGEKAVEVLIKAIEGDKRPGQIRLDTNFIKRESA